MLVDASVARSFGVIGWTRYLLQLGGGTISQQCTALISCSASLPNELTVLTLSKDELDIAVQLQSRRPEDREWRRSLGARSRRLDAGESASIAIALSRSQAFASDDEDALTLWKATVGSAGHRTRDLLRQLVTCGAIDEDEARQTYQVLQTDDLHNLGGPPW